MGKEGGNFWVCLKWELDVLGSGVIAATFDLHRCVEKSGPVDMTDMLQNFQVRIRKNNQERVLKLVQAHEQS